MTIKGAPRPILLALVALAAGLCIAACGSSSSSSAGSSSGSSSGSTPSSSASSGSSGAKTTTTASTGFAAERVKLQACLKAHGVTLPPRPAGGGPPVGGTSTTRPRGSGGGGGFFGGGGGFAARNPKFAAAFKACGADFGGRGAGHFGAGGGRFTPHFSTAILTSFAACVKKHGFTLPKPNTSGKGPIFPANIESNKTFQAASKSCASILRAGFRPPGAGGTSTTGTTASS